MLKAQHKMLIFADINTNRHVFKPSFPTWLSLISAKNQSSAFNAVMFQFCSHRFAAWQHNTSF